MFGRFSIDVGWRRVGGGLDWRRSKWLKIGKNDVSHFWIFTHLYKRFRPCRVLQTIDLKEIYRSIPKMISVMLCGSFLGRLFALCMNIVVSSLKTDRTSIENLLNIFRVPSRANVATLEVGGSIPAGGDEQSRILVLGSSM